MSTLDALLVVLAGIAAGTINTIVGSGTLITFPTLLLLGIPPVTANISNNIGLVPGSLTGAIGYRKELVGAAPTLRRLAPMSFLGAVVGALLLLVLNPDLFRAIVPVLILVGLVLVVTGPRINAWAAPRASWVTSTPESIRASSPARCSGASRTWTRETVRPRCWCFSTRRWASA